MLFSVMVSNTNAQVWVDSLRKAQDLYKSQDFDNALKLYKEAKVSQMDDVMLKKELAQSAYRSEDFEFAQSAFQSALEQESNTKNQADLYYNKGNVCYKQGDYKGAIKNYKTSIIKNPNNQDAKYNLSQALRKENESQSKSSNKEQDSSKEQDPQMSKNSKKEQEQDFSLEKQASERALNKLLQNAQETRRKLANKKMSTTKKGKDW